MTQETVIAELQRLGMSGYEAKAYIALVAAGAPLNGYEVAKRSGVPRSTVYETLNKLCTRGAAYEVRTGDDNVGYLSLPPTSLLDRLRRDFESSIEVLSAQLPEITAPPEVRLLHGLDSQPGLVLRAQDVVAAARHDLFVSGWPSEIETLKDLMKEAAGRGVEVSVVSFGRDSDPVGSTTEHRYSEPDVVLENLGCRLLVVAADRNQAVIGGLTERGAWGVYTDDPAVVLVAVEFVRHDIAMHLVVDRLLDPAAFEEFWVNDDAIKRLRADHGAAAEVLRQTYRHSQHGRGA
ncbi:MULTISPECIES: TrmB family transcriptional regulator [Mumia]|uniref:TrmB family transcriptional regulator n=1 Tax=Mumia TaxID=1546255 RepID=UPI00141DA094|nr:TrmB family transcriptional regulator [Mumia sp. ZJ430]